ncbi:hypothetical protein GUA87_03770 [Sneathiella sp. P13V-1]|uniref:hypothetical protein n=1 Tax=Sneathiella sp. P13V-1 TaxID=2697366 RepID=UPI00187B2F0A|nr:hypothetical protein [Sneathiella sp. P13V-1]MBE7635948.1 hypothetical protein [Sneathiella sp. P13V-1]
MSYLRYRTYIYFFTEEPPLNLFDESVYRNPREKLHLATEQQEFVDAYQRSVVVDEHLSDFQVDKIVQENEGYGPIITHHHKIITSGRHKPGSSDELTPISLKKFLYQ